MNLHHKLKPLSGLLGGAALFFLSFVQGGAQWSNPLYVRGYQTYTNVAYVDPANSAILQVRTGGEGGMAHLGKMRSWSADQQNDLVNGTVTATYTFEDPNGDQLVLSAIGPSAFQPDGRITFNGVYTVIGGTGRYAEASGTLCYDGWARATDFATGQGIGFLNIEGVIFGAQGRTDAPSGRVEVGGATFVPPNFTYAGSGLATGVGKYDNAVHNTQGPFNAAFIGIIDGKVTLSWSFEDTWTVSSQGQLRWSGVQFVHFDTIALPDGSLAADFTKPSVAEIYQTVESGTGRFTQAQGVSFNDALFTPTGPNTVSVHLNGSGYFSR